MQNQTKRIATVDILRGIVMIIMALDHTRDLLHTSSLSQSPTDLNTTTPALFFTRWITHLCAPTFVFLSGVSAYLSFTKKQNAKESRRYLLTRGLWLIFIELTLVNFGIWFDIHFSVIFFNVLSVMGFGFIILSFLLPVNIKTIGILGLAIIFLHGLAPIIPLAEDHILKKILMPLFAPAAFPLPGARQFIIGYPPLPWLGVMLAGFAAGKYIFTAAINRKKIMLATGAAAVLLLIVLRFVNMYGDPVNWITQKNPLFTFLSFINLNKYPPSLDFCLLFLGLMLIIASVVENRSNRLLDFTMVYGKVPLFYFIVHWFIIHPIVFIMLFVQGVKPSQWVFGFNFGRPAEGTGLSLPLVYLMWIIVVAIMYPLSKWYGRYKMQHPEKKWLRYM